MFVKEPSFCSFNEEEVFREETAALSSILDTLFVESVARFAGVSSEFVTGASSEF